MELYKVRILIMSNKYHLHFTKFNSQMKAVLSYIFIKRLIAHSLKLKNIPHVVHYIRQWLLEPTL